MYAVRGLPRTFRPVSCSLLLAAISGCQLWVDVNAPHCTSDKFCASLLGKGFTCGSGNICVAPADDAEPDAGPSDARPPLPARWQCVRDAKKDFIPDASKKITLRMD